jgi:methylisocitrate lyase
MTGVGINIVIYPNETFRFAMHAVDENMPELFTAGPRKHLIDKLQKRTRLYEILAFAARPSPLMRETNAIT